MVNVEPSLVKSVGEWSVLDCVWSMLRFVSVCTQCWAFCGNLCWRVVNVELGVFNVGLFCSQLWSIVSMDGQCWALFGLVLV